MGENETEIIMNAAREALLNVTDEAKAIALELLVEVAALSAENERLRTALTALEAGLNAAVDYAVTMRSYGNTANGHAVIARAALSPVVEEGRS